jgi:hypothetical protein
MFCLYCGTENSNIVKFCTKCGKPLKQALNNYSTENIEIGPSLKLVQRLNNTNILNDAIKKIQNWADSNNFKILSTSISKPNFYILLSKNYKRPSKLNLDLTLYLVFLGFILSATGVITQLENEKILLFLLFIPLFIYISFYLFKKVVRLSAQLEINGTIKSNKVEIQIKSNKNFEKLNNDISNLKKIFQQECL